MLDLKFIIQNPELIQYACDKKHIKDFNVKDLININTRRVDLLKEIEGIKNEQKSASNRIASGLIDSISRESLIAKIENLKETLISKEESLKMIMIEWQKLMLSVPNIPDMTVPEGENADKNITIKEWGDKSVLAFEAKSHEQILENLNILDLERGVKVHGYRGYFLKGLGVNLTLALCQYAFSFWSKKNFTPILTPSIVKKNAFIATANLPQNEEDLYKTTDSDYLINSSETAIIGMHFDEILENLENNAIKYLTLSSSYKKHAFNHNEDVNSIIKTHEFYNIEQIIICEANHITSVNLHEEINKNVEEFIESLGLPYRTVVNCGGDLGLGQVKKYGVELWSKKEGKYKEFCSSSYFHDFQTRRANIKYKDKNGNIKFAHSLACSNISIQALIGFIADNFQNEDGTINIPEVIKNYLL